MKIALACDPPGMQMKEALKTLLDELGLPYHDYGMYETETVRDYPVFAARAARAVASGECERGILVCGTGVGISICANKIKGIRCCCCSDCYSAKLSRQHNDANMLAMGARVIAPENALMIARLFLTTEFEGGRHARRVSMIAQLEEGKDIE